MSLRQDSPANPGPVPVTGEARQTNETCGPKQLQWFALYDHNTYSWRTSQTCLPGVTDISDKYSETWPKAGMMLDGVVYRQPSWERHIGEIGCGLWPSPRSTALTDGDANFQKRKAGGKVSTPKLGTAVHMWLTPDAGQGKRYGQHPGRINPQRTFTLNDAVRKSIGGTPTRRTFPTPNVGGEGPQTHGQISGQFRKQMERATGEKGQLNPEWVELLMGWPQFWTCLDPMNVLSFSKWLRGFRQGEAHAAKGGKTETVPNMRQNDAAQEVRNAPGGLGGLEEAKVLHSFVCEHKEIFIQVGLAVAGKQISQEELRGLWNKTATSDTPPRRKSQEHKAGELADPVHLVPQIYPSYGRAAWLEGTWEAAIPRVAQKIAHRVDRLKALGNGQVPAVAAAAWRLLNDGYKQCGEDRKKTNCAKNADKQARV